jgi:hypothetical protein
MNLKRIKSVPLIACCATGILLASVFPGKEGFDRYGGYKELKGEATGRFHLDTINGRHFLITPEGHGFVSIGVSHTGGMANPEDSKVDCLQEKFGGDWEKATKDLQTNFRSWGYNSLGYGGHPTTCKVLPHFASSHPSGKVSTWMGKQVEFPDVFSDIWKKEARKNIQQMAKRYDPKNPNLIGVYWTDMPAWDLDHSKRRTGKTWMEAIRQLPENAPGKARYQRYLKEEGTSASDKGFMVIMAREVYSFIGPLTKILTP